MTVTRNTIKPISDERFNELSAVKDDEIDCSDIPEIDKDFFKTHELLAPIKKEKITIRIDSDVLKWLKKTNKKGYQSVINQIIRTYYESVK
ncbi:MAG: hypothetical protein A2086_05800 [Spirochaetes bacterium GWD1_27_9]|nr:MAG: hypothetical protein A2Z98_04630 [Spirochaetes bacterium GWB1_27_13]OHD35291.1 MAG: hypothetical protein A2086_05800 [Spirochaetes bacterium GWD1_27_9]